MCLKNLCVAILLLSVTGVCAAATSIVPTTTLAAQTGNNTSAANTFTTQTNGNSTPGNVSKVDVHSLLYAGANTKVYAHLLLWFGESNHMSIGYSSTDPSQIHQQITDMVSRGIDGVIIDWYGPNNAIDQATKLVMTEAETHPGFTFAIMIDQGAIEWYSCSGCTPQAALENELQYIQQTYFPSPAYMTLQGKPVVTNFNVDLSYTVDWNQATATLSTQPAYIFQNNNGFSHVLSDGSYAWVMPTTTDYGIGYLTSFYDIGMTFPNEDTVGATYKGFNDTLASWGSNRIMGQQCGQTWLQTFAEVNKLYSSGKQLPLLQLVTWNDYEEATEIETGINNCLTVSASSSANTLQWSITGNENTVDHYVAYISQDGQNLMALGEAPTGTTSVNLCSYSIPDGNYTAFVQAVGRPSIMNQTSAAVPLTLSCNPPPPPPPPPPTLTLSANPSSMVITSGGAGNMTVTVAAQSGSYTNPVALACSGLPSSLSCSFAPASVTPGSGGASSVLTVTNTVAVAANRGEPRNFLFGSWLFGFGLVGMTIIGRVQRRRLLVAIGACAIAALLSMGTSCAGISTGTVNPSTTVSPVSNYAVTINGTAGSVQLSTTVTVTVK
jgi:hypothetical protein